ncbi:hypothetical protein HDF14_002435 [Edaphobacter lichenicola]|jgi:hypothetical protein|uniref:Uncharacterized protein n=1 Tax=Tunturiibacter gelidiferens TaxID=3069689 RepID=A0A9X0QEL7_9BACT|nr:hypothetical protein [Edaphobacter lichenicola]
MTTRRLGVFSEVELATHLSPCRAELASPSVTDDMIDRLRKYEQEVKFPNIHR